MSTLRITNIEAKADPSSPTVDEKIKLTNSNGDILVHIDGKTSGITTIGINTTAGNIKFDQNSNVVVTGIITATKFVGTIEPTSLEIGSNIKLGNAGVITATSYVGDGSALTGITGTTINNNADNRLITGSGTANTLEGEANLTYDGTDLVLNGSGDKALRWATGGTNKWSLYHNNGSGALVAYDNANNAERLRITSAGLIRVHDSASLTFGNNDDMRIFHDGGSANYIDVYNKDLYIRCNRDSGITGGDIVLQPKSGENSAIFRDDGNVELYYDNALKLETVSNGTKTTGRIFLNGTNGGFDYNNTAHTLEFLVSNGTTHSELNNTAYVPNTNGGKHLGWSNKRWDNVYCNGVLFGGDSTAANTLDDYEEGTWTPAITNTGYTYTYTTQEGQYTKIGRLVTLRFRIVISARSGSASGGGAVINLPITPDGTMDGAPYHTAMPSELIVHKVGTTTSNGAKTLLFGGLANSNTSYFWVNNPTVATSSPFDLGSDFNLGGVITYTA